MKTGQTNGFISLTGSEGGVRLGEHPAQLFVFVITENLAGLWVDQMHLSAYEARHLDVSEIIVKAHHPQQAWTLSPVIGER